MTVAAAGRLQAVRAIGRRKLTKAACQPEYSGDWGRVRDWDWGSGGDGMRVWRGVGKGQCGAHFDAFDNQV